MDELPEPTVTGEEGLDAMSVVGTIALFAMIMKFEVNKQEVNTTVVKFISFFIVLYCLWRPN